MCATLSIVGGCNSPGITSTVSLQGNQWKCIRDAFDVRACIIFLCSFICILKHPEADVNFLHYRHDQNF